MQRSSWLVVIALALGACGDNLQGTCLPDCTGDRSYDALSYHLQARFDWGATHAMTASEDISIVAPAPVVELDARVEISRVHAGATELAFTADAESGRLRVDLSPLSPGTDPVSFTVDFTALPSSALLVGGPRDDDPVRGTVLFTDSEPDRGLAWLVAKHDPSDRARWSIDLDLPGELDAVANGTRVSDEASAIGHVVSYAMPQELPTYLMAFAAGDLVHADRSTGHIPLAIWHRRGLAIDPDLNLDAVADAMATFEALVGPYPFDSYSVVLAPGYGGGMENATITFNAESSGVGNVGFVLNAHELAHHWFGDWVTMRTYDDVWVKEGMATLLEAEAQRSQRDQGTSVHRLFGGDHSFRSGDAVVDAALHGLDKYTTGPYERAAWMITQVRSLVGEDAFWGSLRRFLADHALDSATGEEFVRAFAPALDDARIQQWLAALPSHDSPGISAHSTATTGGTQLVLGLTDPGHTLLAPIEISVLAAGGVATEAALSPAAPLTVLVPTGGYLAADERDVHASWGVSFEIASADEAAVSALSLPSSASAIDAWGARSAARQERTLDDAGLPPADVTAIVAMLDSTRARRSAVFAGCASLANLGLAEAAALRTALGPLIANPAVPTYTSTYAACGAELAQGLAGELASLTTAVTPATSGRLDYLLSFDYGDSTLALISHVAATAPTLGLRDRAIARLALSTVGVYGPISSAQLPAWQAVFRGFLASVTSQPRLSTVWRGVLGLRDVTALPLVAPLLHSVPMQASTQRAIACGASQIARSTPGAWEAFQQATKPWDTLSPEAAAVLADETRCQTQRWEESVAPSKVARELHSL